MTDRKFRKILELIDKRIQSNIWANSKVENRYHSFVALDTERAVEHSLFFYNSFNHGIEQDGGPWYPMIIGVSIFFPRIEKIIDNALSRSGDKSSSIQIYLKDVAPEDLFYLGQFYLLNIGSDDLMQSSVDGLMQTYFQTLEPLRLLMRAESCLDDPSFYPIKNYRILSWELRRAAYYSEALELDLFASYISRLKGRVAEYRRGLEGDESLSAQTARGLLDELEKFIAAAGPVEV